MAIRTYAPEYAVAATVDSQLLDAGSVTSDWVDMGTFDHVDFVINVGATDTTFDAKVQSADDSSGTNNTDISGLAITQLTATDDNEQVILRVRSDQLNTGDTHVAVVVTAGDGTTGVQVAGFGLGFYSNYGPATEYDLASVSQIVSL